MDLHALTIGKARELLSQGKISSVELTRALLDRIDSGTLKLGYELLVDERKLWFWGIFIELPSCVSVVAATLAVS